ncbi:helix-turn-helix domain-containing protein [Methylobacterium sp. D54C]
MYRRLDETDAGSIPALRAELLAFLLRILDPSQAPDTLEGRELDEGLFAVARRVIGDRLREPGLSPNAVAEAMGISRSSLYRLFVPVGGVMDYVQERRLLAMRDALADPVERRTITQLADDLGFASLPHLSKSFRARFGWTPRAWRAHSAMLASAQNQSAPEPFWRWFDTLGARHVSGRAQTAVGT